ncbi:MAG: Fe-S cluster assembly protein HesB [Actinomycetota bacterium]|nr:Fe-S cluster assembly protein HesB [Actinomycetota bacterium]
MASHGVASLPPARIDEHAWTLELTLPVPNARPRTVVVSDNGPAAAAVHVRGPRPRTQERDAVLATVRHVLRLDEDLSRFYELVRDDPELSWAARGAGRMLRAPTVFEDVVKTICTTNCAWSGTVRMVGALVEHLGEPAAGTAPNGPYGRAFPTPAAMAQADLAFYGDVGRAGYRGAYLRSLAEQVASGALDLEALGRATPAELPDEELAARLLALPGVGPYAASHVMMLLGRYSPLVLDSWTRPTYARLTGGRPKSDTTIRRRFRRYGPYAGLAFWLFLTRSWVDDDGA